ncbi:unnamed protein product [Ambrosiozyma monospora]|uniref:Unnamed protein product n=1 Tax=Ambrosiozyma monospora TaxID=43982 RepID=A0ACB5TF90_AMBMO|nr:unnamed protein product [Ambrosiozyma monospora]
MLELLDCIQLVYELPLEITHSILKKLPIWFLLYLSNHDTNSKDDNNDTNKVKALVQDIIYNTHIVLTKWYSHEDNLRQISVQGEEFKILCMLCLKDTTTNCRLMSDTSTLESTLSAITLTSEEDNNKLINDKTTQVQSEENVVCPIKRVELKYYDENNLLLDTFLTHCTQELIVPFHHLKKMSVSQKFQILHRITCISVGNMSFRLVLRETPESFRKMANLYLTNVKRLNIYDYITSGEFELFYSCLGDKLSHLHFDTCWADLIPTLKKLGVLKRAFAGDYGNKENISGESPLEFSVNCFHANYFQDILHNEINDFSYSEEEEEQEEQEEDHTLNNTNDNGVESSNGSDNLVLDMINR